MNNSGCLSITNVILLVDSCDKTESLYIPNAFTPNGDGKNDIYYAYGNEVKTFTMLIYSKWGEKLFETSYTSRKPTEYH